MSRFASRLGLAAIAALGLTAASAPASADVAPAVESCTHWSSRGAAPCRAPVRSARRYGPRTVVVAPTVPLLGDVGGFPAGRYASLLILGVGF